jgi:hypothetical protein
MIQAAHVAPAAAAVTPSASSSAGAPSGGEQPRRGRHGRCSGPPEAALRQSAPSRPRPPSAALPVAEACPPYGDRRGPRCARQAPGRTSTAARTAAVAALWAAAAGRRARSACAPACGSGRSRSLRPGPRRPGARSVRALALASQGGRVRAVTQSCRNRLHGRRRLCAPPVGCAPSRRQPLRLNGAPVPAPEKLRSLGAPCASRRPLLALRLAASAPLLRRCTATTSRRSPRLALRRA